MNRHISIDIRVLNFDNGVADVTDRLKAPVRANQIFNDLSLCGAGRVVVGQGGGGRSVAVGPGAATGGLTASAEGSAGGSPSSRPVTATTGRPAAATSSTRTRVTPGRRLAR